MTTAVEEVHLWRCACPASSDANREFLQSLSADERRRAASYARVEHRERFITSRGTLRRILSGYADTSPEMLKFRLGIFGKPKLDCGAGSALPFNLSRAGNCMLIAVAPGATGEIGVDLIEIHSKHCAGVTCRELLADHFPQFLKDDYSERECERVFARAWSQSEAILKARGTGLSASALPSLDCVLSGALNVWRALSDGPEPSRILCELSPIDGFAAALVFPGPLREIHIRIFDGDFERPLKNIAHTLQEAHTAAL